MKKRKLRPTKSRAGYGTPWATPTFNEDPVVPVYVVNPFVSEAQRRACYAADDPDWDCEEWEAATDGKRLPARKAAKKRKGKLKANRGPVGNAKRKPNPLKYDPTRTLTLRRSFCAQLRRQFAILKGRIVKLIVEEDALGLKEPEPPSFNSAKPDPETALEQRLIKIAKEAYRRKRRDGSPDYGQLFFKSETREVWYCGADGDTSELFDWLDPLLEKEVGKDHVTIEAEAYPPRDDGWVQLFPKRKPVTANFNPDQPRDAIGRFGSGGSTPSAETSGRYSPKASDAPKGSLLARMKSSVSSRLPPWVQRWTAKLTKAAFVLTVAGNKAVQAVAKERGLTPEKIAKLSKVVGTVDVATGGSRAGGIATAVGLGALALPASLVPWGSVSYLAYSTARNPLATLRAARNGIQSAVRKLRGGSKSAVLSTNTFCPTGVGGGVDPSCSPGGTATDDESGSAGPHLSAFGGRTPAFKVDHPHAKRGPNPELPDATRPPIHAAETAQSLHAYSWGSDGPMNKALRETGAPPVGTIGGGKGKPEVDGEATFKAMQGVFAAAKPFGPPPVVVTRGLDVDAKTTRQIEAAARKAMDKGHELVMPGFISTTTDPGAEFSGKVKYRIAAVHGVDMKPYTQFPMEDELLLNHNSRFKVTKVERVEGEVHIHLEQLHPHHSPTVHTSWVSGITVNTENRMEGDEDEALHWIKAFENAQPTTNVSQVYTEAIEDALSAHNYSDWYIALLHCALDETRDVQEAIALADAAHEDQPEDTSSPQEDDGEAVFGKEPPTANEGWVTLESGQRVFIGPKGEFSPSGPAESWEKGKSGKRAETGETDASGSTSSVGTCQVHTDSLKHLVSTNAPPVHVDALSKQLGLQFQSVGTDPEYGDALYQVSFHPTTNRNELLAKLKSSGWDVVRVSSDRLTAYPVAKRPLPDTVYHWVPSSAVDSVLRDGLLPGDRDRSSKLAGEWATHGAGKVFLSGTEGGGRWGKIFAGRLHEDMVLLRVDTKGLDAQAYHDNASQPRSGRMSIDNEAMWIQGVSIPASRLTVAGVHSHKDDKFAANFHQPEMGMLLARMVNYLPAPKRSEDEDQVKEATENFDPDQTRDEHGRWSKDGGGIEGATLMPPMAAPKSRAIAADKVATRKEAAAVKAKSKAAEAKDKAKQATTVAKQAAKVAVAARRTADKATKLAGKAKDKLESAKAKLAAASTPKAKAQAKAKVAEAKADADRTKKEAAKAEREAKKAEKEVASAVTKRDREAMKARTEEEKSKDATADAKEARAEAKRAAKEEKQGPKVSSGGKTKAGETAMEKLAKLQAAGTARREAEEKAKRDAEPVLTPGQKLTRDQITARLDRIAPLPDSGHYTYFNVEHKRRDEAERIINEVAVRSGPMSVHGMSRSEEMRTVHVDGVAIHIADGVSSRVAGGSLINVLSGRMPQKLWEATHAIVFSTQDNKDDDHWRRTYANWSDKDKSLATGGDGTICVYRGQEIGHAVWAHESGHNLAYKTFGSTLPAHGSEYEVAQRQERPVTTYGSNSAAEDFAEACMMYADRAETAASYKERLKARQADPHAPLAYHTKLKHDAPLKFAAIARIMGEDPHAPGTINRLLGNTRWKFTTDSDKVKAFQQWMTEQLDSTLLSSSQEAQWRAYIEAGYRKGAGRAFDDGKAAARGQQTLDYYAGTRDEFLRSTFAQPVSVERVKLLAGRSYDDMENVTADMSTRMSRSLVDGLIQGKSPREIAGSLSDDLDLSRSRAETIARTEVIRAHAEGQLDSMQQLGVDAVGVQVEWLATEDGNQCDECSDLEGTVLPIDEARGMLPRHPNCRCCWLPALGDLAANAAVRNAKDYGSGRWITLEDSGQHVFISGEGEFLPKGPGSGKGVKEEKSGASGDKGSAGGKPVDLNKPDKPGASGQGSLSLSSIRARLKATSSDEERHALMLEIMLDHARPPQKLKPLKQHGMSQSEVMHSIEIDGLTVHFSTDPEEQKKAAEGLSQVFRVRPSATLWGSVKHLVMSTQEYRLGTDIGSAAATGGDGIIVNFGRAGRKPAMDAWLFNHEASHCYAEREWKNVNPPRGSVFAKMARDKSESPVTPYGHTNLAEDFAEACGMFISTPKAMKEKFPKRYAAVEKILGTEKVGTLK
jgi:SPP1 gp7 family putative phage head morphogenesis protein